MTDVTSKTARELFGPDQPPATHTRQRLIDAAMDLFLTHGFHAVGLDAILDRVGITKTAFYNHFQSKDDLILAVIQTRAAWEAETFERLIRERAGDDPRARLLAYFDVLHEWFNRPEYRGCLFISASAEFPSPHDPVHQAGKDYRTRFMGDVRATAEAAGVAEPESFARQYLLLSEGATSTRQSVGDDQAALRAKELVAVMLSRSPAKVSEA